MQTSNEPAIAPMQDDMTSPEECPVSQEETVATHDLEPLITEPVQDSHVNRRKGWGYSRLS